jgi:hypothetical protein
MPDSVNPLMLEFLTWISSRRRTYDEAMEAWRTTCPRYTVWEDAIIDGLIQVGGTPHQSEVTLTPRGRDILDEKHRCKSV